MATQSDWGASAIASGMVGDAAIHLLSSAGDLSTLAGEVRAA